MVRQSFQYCPFAKFGSRRSHAFSFIASVTFGACLVGQVGKAWGQTLNLPINGVSRSYVLHAPSGLTHPPLVFVLHGHGMTGTQQQNDVKMDVIADREKFIVTYPNAIDMNWDQAGTSDTKFILTLIDSLDAKYHIDLNRVYVTGFSQGAAMTHAMGCAYADKFAAIAPVSGNIPANCAPKRAMPMFMTFGTKDLWPAKDLLAGAQKWSTLDSCSTTPSILRPYPASNTNSVVTRITWSSCKGGAEVIADSVQGGGHEWPMDTRTKVNNSEEVWAFFKRFSLASVTDLHQSSKPSAEGLTLIYRDGRVYLHGLIGSYRIRVLDTQGRLVVNGESAEGSFSLANQPAGIYQVFLQGNGTLHSARLVLR